MGALFLPLPNASSPTLRLTHATPTQKLLQSLENSAVWRGPLSVAAYLRREKYLENQPLTTSRGITHWVLIDSAEPESPRRRVLCSCQTIRKRALVVREGQTQDTIAHCVTNVFCPSQHSRRGYATRMMKELGNVLGTYQTEESSARSLVFSALWSDIGKKFYAEHGWEPFPSSHISIPAVSPLPTRGLYSQKHKLKLLRASDIGSLCAADEQNLRKALAVRPPDSPPAICLVPDHATISWHHAREDFIATELYSRTSEIKGALVSGPEPGQRAWCYWTLSWPGDPHGHHDDLHNHVHGRDDGKSCNPNTLHILRLAFENANAQSIEMLLRAAQRYAGLWNMGSVQFWNPSPEAAEAARRIDLGVQVVDREEQSIASIKWFGPDGDRVGMEWLGNEKYAWC